MKPVTIETEAVRLRVLRDDDAGDIEVACSDPETQRFLHFLPHPYTRADALSWIREGAPAQFATGGASYAIADPATDRLLGTVGLHHVDPSRAQGEVGYWVAPWARGRGVARAAVRAIAAHAFGEGLARLEALVEWENAKSMRVLLAAGFGREGVRRAASAGRDGTRHDLVALVRLADDREEPVARALPDLPGGALTDGVVTLRRLGPDDADFYHDLLNTPDIVATMVPPVPPDRDEIRMRCGRAEAHWLFGDRADLVIVDAPSGRPAGEIGLYYQEPATGQAMIGYAVADEFRGRGFATRASVLVARWAFAETGIKRLIAGTNPTNTGSQRVLAAAGFLREGYQRSRLPGIAGGRIDDVLWALLPQDLR